MRSEAFVDALLAWVAAFYVGAALGVIFSLVYVVACMWGG